MVAPGYVYSRAELCGARSLLRRHRAARDGRMPPPTVVAPRRERVVVVPSATRGCRRAARIVPRERLRSYLAEPRRGSGGGYVTTAYFVRELVRDRHQRLRALLLNRHRRIWRRNNHGVRRWQSQAAPIREHAAQFQREPRTAQCVAFDVSPAEAIMNGNHRIRARSVRCRGRGRSDAARCRSSRKCRAPRRHRSSPYSPSQTAVETRQPDDGAAARHQGDHHQGHEDRAAGRIRPPRCRPRSVRSSRPAFRFSRCRSRSRRRCRSSSRTRSSCKDDKVVIIDPKDNKVAALVE